jgi:hypothetical protein
MGEVVNFHEGKQIMALARRLKECLEKFILTPTSELETEFRILQKRAKALGYTVAVLAHRNKKGDVTRIQLAVQKIHKTDTTS